MLLKHCVLQRVAACCSVLQRVAACCRVLQHVAACCSVLLRRSLLQHRAHLEAWAGRSPCIYATEALYVAACCSVLQCIAVCCSVLQHVAVRRNILQHRAHLEAWARRSPCRCCEESAKQSQQSVPQCLFIANLAESWLFPNFHLLKRYICMA